MKHFKDVLVLFLRLKDWPLSYAATKLGRALYQAICFSTSGESRSNCSLTRHHNTFPVECKDMKEKEEYLLKKFYLSERQKDESQKHFPEVHQHVTEHKIHYARSTWLLQKIKNKLTRNVLLYSSGKNTSCFSIYG